MALGCCGWSSTNAFPAETVAELEQVVVTGSSIRSSEKNVLLPLRVVDREEIETTGAQTVNDLMKYLPEVDFLDSGLQSSNTVAAGASFIRLRGLPASNTLVLIDGHRLPLNPVQSSNGIDAAVDINLIPLSAIERVEILKSTGSAIYGADAVAGVVNLITRKHDTSIRVAGNYGVSKYGDGEDKRFSLSAGRGDLRTDRFNGMVVLEHAERDPIYRADRDLTKTADFRRLGGTDLRSTNAPEGNITSGLNTGNSLRPCAPENLNGTICRYDTNVKPSTALLGMDTWNLLTQGAWQLTDTTRWNLQLSYARKALDFAVGPTPGTFTLPSGQTIQGRLMQGGDRTSVLSNTLYHLHTALEGVAFAQHWEVSAGYGAASSHNRYGNRFTQTQLQSAIGAGLIDPTVSTNDQARIDALKVSPDIRSSTSLAYLNAHLSGSLWRGERAGLQYATGLQWRRETLKELSDERIVNGEILGFAARPTIDAGRASFGAFGELKFDLSDQLRLQTALRYDDFGTANNLSKKLALAYTPDKRLSLRGNWGESFLMPSLSQMYSTGSSSSIVITGSNCALIGQSTGCAQPGFLVNRGATDLRPETSTSWGVGVDAKPFPFLRSSLDYWHIDKTNEIVRPSAATALQNGLFRIQNGFVYIDSQNVNLSSTRLSGVDFGLNVNIYLGHWGDLSISNTLTHYLSYKRRTSPLNSAIDNLGYASGIPEWRNQLVANWYKGDWSTSLFIRSTSGFIDASSAASVTTATGRVPSYTEADLIVGYAASRNLKLTVGVQNFTNAKPPFSQTAASTYQGSPNMPYYDVRGAYYFVSANYQFDAPH